MKNLNVFVAAIQRPDGLFDVYLASGDTDRIVHTARVAGEVFSVRSPVTMDAVAVVGLLVGAAAGLAGVPVNAFVDLLKVGNEKFQRGMKTVDGEPD